MSSTSKLSDEEIRECSRSGLDDLPGHEQCIDFHRAKVSVGQNTNEFAAFHLGLCTLEAYGHDP